MTKIKGGIQKIKGGIHISKAATKTSKAASKISKVASKITKVVSKISKVASKRSKTAPKILQVAFKGWIVDSFMDYHYLTWKSSKIECVHTFFPGLMVQISSGRWFFRKIYLYFYLKVSQVKLNDSKIAFSGIVSLCGMILSLICEDRSR